MAACPAGPLRVLGGPSTSRCVLIPYTLIDAAVASLRRLAEQSHTAGMNFDGEYEQVDTDGCPISEEIAIG